MRLIRRVWLIFSMGWTLIWGLLLGLTASNEQLQWLPVWLALPWVTGPLVVYLLRFIFTGRFRRQVIPYTYYRRSDV